MMRQLLFVIAAMSLSTIERVIHGATTPSYYPGLTINCNDCPRILDLCFLLDGSQSICKDDPNYKSGDTTCNNWSAMINFSHNIVADMNIGDGLTDVGLVVFATKGNRRFNLSRYSDEASLLAAIDQTPYPAGTTNTSGGLNVMMDMVFSSTYGDRPNVPDVAIIITNSRATDPSTVQAAIDRVHAANVTTIAIGELNHIDENSLKQLASDPKQINKTYFFVDHLTNLNQILPSVLNQICYGS